MKPMITAVLLVSLALWIGCSLSGYEERPSEHYDILNDVRKRFQDVPFKMLTRYAGDYKVSTPQLIRSVSNRKLYRMSVSTPTYMISPIEIKVSQHGNITDVTFRQATFSPIPEMQQEHNTSSHRQMSNDAVIANVNRIATEQAKSMVRSETQKLQRKFDQDLRQAKWDLEQEYNQNVANLRSQSRILDDLSRAIASYQDYNGRNFANGNRQDTNLWLIRYHPQIAKNLDLFQELIMFLAMQAPTSEMFEHYQKIGNLVNVKFTKSDVYSREYPILTKLPGYKIVKSNDEQ